MTRIVSLDAHGTRWILEDHVNAARFRMIRSQLRYARSLDRASREARAKDYHVAADILQDHARGVRQALRNGLREASIIR